MDRSKLPIQVGPKIFFKTIEHFFYIRKPMGKDVKGKKSSKYE